MKPAHKLLFILCPMLVLGFIYYSSGKLHLHVWGQKPHKGVAATVKVSKVTKNTVKSPETKEPVVEGPVSVGRIVGSVFDKQGFLLNLETKLPPELVYKYGNLSEGSCKPGYAAAKMTAIYPNFFKPAFDLQGFAKLSSLSSSDLSTNSVNGGPLC